MSRLASLKFSLSRQVGIPAIVVALAVICGPAVAQPGGGGTPWPPTGIPPSVDLNSNGIRSLLNGGIPGVPNFTPFTNIEFSSTVPVNGEAECSIGINPNIPGLLLRDPRVRLLPLNPALQPRLIFGGPTDDCSLGLLTGIPGLAEFDPVGFRLMGNWDGQQTTDGCRLIFGPTDDCRIEVDPQASDGLRLYDPNAIRICNPDPTVPPPFLRFGPTDDCSLGIDPAFPGLLLRDPIGIRILQPELAGPPARLFFGPDNLCAFGLLQGISGLAEFDPVGLRLMGDWDGQQTTQGCRLIFGPTDDCRIEIDPLLMDGLRLYDPTAIRICNPLPGFPPPFLRFGPTDDCSLGIDPQVPGLIVRDVDGLVLRNIGSSGKDGVDVRLSQVPAATGRRGLRVSNLGSSGKDGVSIDFGPTGDCRLEAIPNNGLRLYDLTGIRICPPLPGLPLPPLFFGDDDLFRIQPQFFGPGSEPFFAFSAPLMAPDFVQSSSKRWKTNIATIENPLEKIQALHGVSFDWDEEHGGKHSIGLIAEEVAEVIPELVTHDADGQSVRGVNYSNLVALLVEGIKRQQEQLEVHGQEVKTLQVENAQLKALVAESAGQSERTDQLEIEVQQLRDELASLMEVLTAQRK